MTNASSDLGDQSHRADEVMIRSSSQLNDEMRSPEQFKVQMDMKNLLDQLDSLVYEFREKSHARNERCLALWSDYCAARRYAARHRIAARMQDSSTIDLDSVTDSEMSHITTMIGWEKKATDICYKLIDSKRSTLPELKDIKKICFQVLELTDEIPKHTVVKTHMQNTVASINDLENYLLHWLACFD